MPSSKKGKKGRSKAKGGRSKAKSNGGGSRSDGAPPYNNDGNSRVDVTGDDDYLKQSAPPPRSTADILGRVGPNSAPTESVIAELESALRGESRSDRHRSVVTRVAEAGGDESPPVTYETPGMVELGLTPLLFGRDAPFRLADLDLPPCDVTVLSDLGMGESDWKGKWKGGSATMMEFMGVKRGPINAFLGECRLECTDLWHFAVQFRRESGKFLWPCYWSVLMCPFCAEFALPDQERQTFIMIVQGLLQKTDNGMSERYLPRICCKECFLSNLQPNGRDWGDYPALLCKSVPAHHFGHDDPRTLEPTPSAYTLSCLFVNCGMSGALDKCTTDIMMQAVGSSSSSARARISKSKTRANRGQTVMKFKDFIRRKCSGCGVQSPGLSACSQCRRVYYCGASCQRKHWRKHKRSCKGSSTSDIAGDAEDMPRPSTEICIAEEGERPSRESRLAKNPCKKCHKKPDDEGCAVMCVSCGEFIVCENCAVTPELGGENSSTTALFFFCDGCRPKAKDAGKNRAGRLLRRLLDERPTGRHVQYARLILAQCMFRDTEEYTGIAHDVKAARDEYMWLANDGDYAPAQLALASFYDPEARASEEIWDGPLNLLAVCEVELPPGNLLLFPPSRRKAVQYYDRAVEQKMMIAIQSVATMYKNGTLYPVDKQKAAMMLREASDMGDGRAMCNLGQMLMRGDGIPLDMQAGLEYYRRAASMGIYSAMFMVAQVGMQNPAFLGEGKEMMQRLRENGWHPPFEHFQQQWMIACMFYDM